MHICSRRFSCAAVAARVVREKYQQEAEEEIAEMRDYYRELRKNAKTPDEDKW